MIRRDPRIHAEAVTASQFAPSAAVFSQVKKNGGQHSKNVWAWGKQAARTDRAPEIVKGGERPKGGRDSRMVCGFVQPAVSGRQRRGVTAVALTTKRARTRLHGNGQVLASLG